MLEKPNGNWVKLSRELFFHELANDKPWNRTLLWIYLIAMASTGERTVRFRGHDHILTRGQVAVSLGDLEARAGWSRDRVRFFFRYLKQREMATTAGDPFCTIVSILNYDKWQGKKCQADIGPNNTIANTIANTIDSTIANDSPEAGAGCTNTIVHTIASTIANTIENKNVVQEIQDKRLRDCVEKEKTDAPLFEDFLKVVEEPETKPDKAIQVTASVPYLLASWFYSFRNIPAQPTIADMRNFKLLLGFYPESVIKKGIEWRLGSDPDGYWATHITIAAVYRQFGNWMAESSVKAISLRQWVEKNPDMGFERFTDPLARADGFMRAFNEAKRNRLVYFEDADYAMYKKAIRIKTSESKAETKEKL